MRDLIRVRKQGKIVAREKRKYLAPLPVQKSIAQLERHRQGIGDGY